MGPVDHYWFCSKAEGLKNLNDWMAVTRRVGRAGLGSLCALPILYRLPSKTPREQSPLMMLLGLPSLTYYRTKMVPWALPLWHSSTLHVLLRQTPKNAALFLKCFKGVTSENELHRFYPSMQLPISSLSKQLTPGMPVDYHPRESA